MLKTKCSSQRCGFPREETDPEKEKD